MMAEKWIFMSRENKDFEIGRNFKEGNVSFPTIHKCNLGCKYCFAQSGENYKGTNTVFSKDVIKKALDFIYKDYFKDCVSYRMDFVSGGEPLLNFDAVMDVVDVSRELFKETGKPMYIWLCTNGTLLSKEKAKYLDENNIGLGISLDGDKNMHNLMRPTKTGKETYDDVIDSISSIINGEYSRRFKEIWVLSVITAKTDSLVNLVKQHKSIGIKRMQIKVIRSDKKSDFSLNGENLEHFKSLYSELVNFYKEEIKQNRTEYLTMILNNNDYLGKILLKLLLRRPTLYRCFAGKNKISITADGEIYPCDSFVGNKDYLMGNIYEGTDKSVAEKFFNLSIYNRKKCSDCWAKFICGGDCHHSSIMMNGTIDEPDEVFCDFNKHLVKLSLELLSVINSNEKVAKYLSLFINTREAKRQ